MLAARGRYIAILNHDDLWRPEWLATAVPVLDSTPEAVLVFCDHDVIDPAGRSLSAEADHTTQAVGPGQTDPGAISAVSGLGRAANPFPSPWAVCSGVMRST